jgi:hypothetical protein
MYFKATCGLCNLYLLLTEKLIWKLMNYSQILEVVTVSKQKRTFFFAKSAINYYKPSRLQGMHV